MEHPHTESPLRAARRWLVGGSIIALTAAMASTAFAADAADAASPAVGEIVVTAQKRAERLQDVPVSVAVVSGGTLQSLHVSDPDELPLISPSLSFSASANTRGQGMSIRGVGTLNFSDGVEPSVSTVIDGVVLGRQAMSTFDLIDIDHIEVLRGPQGTLFGKNSSAGVINIVTQAPSSTFGGQYEASYATLNEVKVRGSVTGPIAGDTLTGRLTAYTDSHDGYIDDVFNGKKLNNQDQWGVRGKLLWKPTPDTDVTFIGDYAKIDNLCCTPTMISVSPTATGALRLGLTAPVIPSADNDQVNIDGAYFLRQTGSGLSAQVDQRLGDFTITSITAYRKTDIHDNNDPDLLPINAFNINSADQQQNQWTEELRITSPAGKRVEYVGGLFYFQQQIRSQTVVGGTFVLSGAAPFSESAVSRGIDTKNGALFGQITGHLTDEFSVIGGARYTTESLDAFFNRFTPAGAIAAPAAFGGPDLHATGLKSDESKLSYRLGLQYEPTRDLMFYATYSKGFKGAALNLLNSLSQALITTGKYLAPPEIPTNYEAGFRSSWLDHRVQLNATTFYTTFQGFQTTAFDPTVGSSILTSAGELTTKGVEIEAIAAPASGLTLTGNVAYTDAYFSDFPNAPCYAGQNLAGGVGCHLLGTAFVQDLKGKPLNNAPKLAFTLAEDYSWDLGVGGLQGILTSNYVYRSKVNFSLNQDPKTVQGAYGLVNVNLGVQPMGGLWRISLFAKNLFDKRYANTIGPSTFDGGGAGALAGYSQITTFDARRIVGVALSGKF